MVTTFVWPWKNEEELLEVRTLFYPDDRIDNNTKRQNQQLAVNIVNTWKLRRTRIPHSILATADLVDAILHHDLTKNSPSTIKAVYASALAKMVTSVCDLEQDSLEKRSMMEQATKIGMPEEWVQLRHAITHGQTPGLKELEIAVREAVPWMWDHFWRGLDGEDVASETDLRGEFIELLSRYRKQRRAMIASKGEITPDQNLTSQTSRALRRACRQRRDGLDQLVFVLLQDDIVLPSPKQTNLKFRAFLLVWDDLLLRIAQRQSNFHSKLVSALTQMLTSWTKASSVQSFSLYVASQWLRHCLLEAKWTIITPPAKLEGLRNDVAESCLMVKNDYTTGILNDILPTLSGKQAESLRQLRDSCEGEQTSDSTQLDFAELAELGSLPIQRTGWSKPVPVWIPRAIGT